MGLWVVFLSGSFTMHDFITLCPCLWKILVTELFVNSPYTITLQSTVSKTHFCCYHCWSLFFFKKSVLESQIPFCKTLIFIWKLEFYHWQQILAVVFLDRTKNSSFSRKCLANTQVQIIIVSLLVSLSVILSVKLKKTASFAYTSVFWLFSPETPVIFQWMLEIL